MLLSRKPWITNALTGLGKGEGEGVLELTLSLPSLPRCVPGIMEANPQARTQLKEPANHGQGLTESANQIHAMHGWSWFKNTEPVLIRLGMDLSDIKIALNVLTRHTVQPHMRSTYRVFTDVVQVKDFLTHPRFVLVDNREDVDILWLREHFKDFRLVVCPLAVFPNILSNHYVVLLADLLCRG